MLFPPLLIPETPPWRLLSSSTLIALIGQAFCIFLLPLYNKFNQVERAKETASKNCYPKEIFDAQNDDLLLPLAQEVPAVVSFTLDSLTHLDIGGLNGE